MRKFCQIKPLTSKRLLFFGQDYKTSKLIKNLGGIRLRKNFSLHLVKILKEIK
jgi:hypothetical protein